LAGGVSAQVSALQVRWPGGDLERLVVREYGERDLRADPDVARREFELLRVLTLAELPVPRPRYMGPGRLVLDFIDGAPEFQPADVSGFVRQLATFLARLHTLPTAQLSFLPVLTAFGPRAEAPDDSLSETRIRDALKQSRPPPVNRAAVLHGDFWPGNVLWTGDHLTAVIDWEDASLGDPLADVANARLELLFFLGPGAMHAFTDEYGRHTGTDLVHLAYWDLCAALRPCGRLGAWGLTAEHEGQMRRRHARFVDAALARP
jgi:aminoglycoside phosphotransferase (APT) family kinase protein